MSCAIACDPTEVALKSFFLGPQSENAGWVTELVVEIFDDWFRWRRDKFPEDGSAISTQDQGMPEFQQRRQKVLGLLQQLTHRFEKELPKFSPRYVGHMFSEISLPALMGHILTLLHNPNIISKESATVGADIENEAIEALAQMLGMGGAFGHFTSGGTVANFESVVRASARVHDWLAMGAVLGGVSMFEAAHMGWKRYREGLARVGGDRLTPYLPERSGPWAAGRALEEAFARPFCGSALIVPRSGHYSWKKAARVFGVGEANLRYVDSDSQGRYRVDHLEQHLMECQRLQQPVLAVVSVTGTTETGAVDPVDRIQDLLDQWKERQGVHIWHHIDAAYGGFLCSLLRKDSLHKEEGLEKVLRPHVLAALSSVGRGDSVTIDPHKLGYVPYSSGAFLARQRDDYTCVQTLAPYIDYRNVGDRGPYTLEGSRSAAGAVATWLTARSIGLDQAGYGLLMARTIRQKQKLEEWLLEKLPSAHVYPGCDTNLLCFCVADPGDAVSLSNQRSLRILQRLSSDSTYFLSKTHFPIHETGVTRDFIHSWNGQPDSQELVMLRLSLMNPFFDSTELDVNHIEHLVFALSEMAD
jgi:glutamate/tyrosine decarboxylase-like PLP-dependent enzyme